MKFAGAPEGAGRHAVQITDAQRESGTRTRNPGVALLPANRTKVLRLALRLSFRWSPRICF